MEVLRSSSASVLSHRTTATGMSLGFPLFKPTTANPHFCSSPKLTILCGALTKQGHRFLSTLVSTAAAGDESATNRLIRKFIASSPKSISLNALSTLLSPGADYPRLSALALALYSRIKEASWFVWNPKLMAELAAVLDKNGHHTDSEILISETIAKIRGQERELVLFYCQLIESHAKHSSERGFDQSFKELNQLVHNSSSAYVKRRAYESIISGLSCMNKPREAENFIERMREKGLNPSAFEYKSLLHGYGRMGLFGDMNTTIGKMENDGFTIDTVSSNMVLSSYGAHNKLSEMVLWLWRMKAVGIPLSIRTYNSVLNSCPMIMSMLRDTGSVPLSMEELSDVLNRDESLLVKELAGSSLMEEMMVWEATVMKLDLHGMHLGTAYLITLQWLKELRLRFNDDNSITPVEITVVCGSGNHSSVRGESLLKDLVKKMMVRLDSPLKIDRKNGGCFVAKGKVVRNWLCKC